MVIEIQKVELNLKEIGRLYPAAVIKYVDGTITQISLEWFDKMANDEIELLHYVICVHYKKSDAAPLFFTYESREELEKEIDFLASVLNG